MAQNNKLPPLSESSSNDKSPASTASKAATSKEATKDETTKGSPTAKAATKTTDSATEPNLPALTSSTEEPSLPALTTSSSGLDGLITNLPKLDQDNHPPPTVPPTANAPFMQKSTLPEGTVFICVGALLGFVGFAVVAWRGLVAWSLHRSVRQAAIAQSRKYGHEKTHSKHRHRRRHSSVPFYNEGPGSTLSLDQLGASGKGGAKTNIARESLFFSPTAGGAGPMSGPRGSGYLPAGYYAAGNSAPGGGSGMTHIGGGSISMGNPNPRFSRARSSGPSPPLSPSLPPSRGEDTSRRKSSTAGMTLHASNSSLNLSSHTRAPSAYLDDLFENHPPGRESVNRRS